MCNMCKKVVVKGVVKHFGSKEITLQDLNKFFPTDGHYCSKVRRGPDFITVKTSIAEKVEAFMIAQALNLI